MHIDMDSFFVSVERLLDPTLVGIPIVVGGSPEQRGVVASASYESRRYGIRSAMPMAEAIQRCPELIIVSGSYGYYDLYSQRVKGILNQIVPVIQQASVDEFYLDSTSVAHFYKDGIEIAIKIKDQITKETGLPCSIGISGSKYLAKIASKMAKPEGIKYLPQETAGKELENLSISIINGIGKKTFERLQSLGITTIGDLAGASISILQSVFGKNAHLFKSMAAGTYVSPSFSGDNEGYQEEEGEERKQISIERTYAMDIEDIHELEKNLSFLIQKLCYKMRHKKIITGNITVKVRFSDFKTQTASKSIIHTNLDHIVFSEAQRLLWKLTARRVRVRLLGIGCSQLQPEAFQLELPLNGKIIHQEYSLYNAIDRIRHKYGFQSIKTARHF